MAEESAKSILHAPRTTKWRGYAHFSQLASKRLYPGHGGPQFFKPFKHDKKSTSYGEPLAWEIC
jgi:hypothetical protein